MAGGEVPGSPPLTAGAVTRVRQGWADRLHVPVDAFTPSGTRFFPREHATAVVVVQLGDSTVVVLPPDALEQLETLDEQLLLHLPTVAERLERFSPHPIGTATLSYRDTPLPRRTSARVDIADSRMIEIMRSACPTDEWDESGLTGMTHRFAALTAQDQPVAVAGHERWGDHLAQMGVATDPGHRGRGHATAVAVEVLDAAVGEGLVAQWRCRVGNTASERLGDHLGFQLLGRQVAVALDTTGG